MTVEIKFYDTSIWPQKRLYRTRSMYSYGVVKRYMHPDEVPPWIDKILKGGGWAASRIRGRMYIINEYPPEYDEVMEEMEKLWDKNPNAVIDFMTEQEYDYCPDCEYRRE